MCISIKRHLPNFLSITRIPLGVIFFLFFTSEKNVFDYTPIIIIVSLLTDYLDGYLARRLDVLSETGKWLDAFADFIFFFFVYLSFLNAGVMPLLLFILFLCREILMYSLIRPLSAARKLQVGAKPSGKAKTALQCIGSLFIAVMSIFFKYQRISEFFFRRSSLITLILLVSFSIISLYWYIKPLCSGGARNV